MTCSIPLAIAKGETFEYAFRIATPTPVLKPITGISRTAPATLTVPGHGLTDAWPFRIEGVTAPADLNSPASDPTQAYLARVADPDTLTLPDINGLGFKAFTGTAAVIRYLAAEDLTGLAARLVVRKSAGGAVADTFLSGDGQLSVDVATATVAINLSAVATAALTWTQGVYDLQLFDSLNPATVIGIASGRITAGT